MPLEHATQASISSCAAAQVAASSASVRLADCPHRPRHNLDSDSERTWRPYTTGTAADGFVLDGEYRLIIAKALTAADPARPCGCPDIGPAVVAGVEIPAMPTPAPRPSAANATSRPRD
jgi:hypothetical protein